jgi:small subunit ribosomal protein S18
MGRNPCSRRYKVCMLQVRREVDYKNVPMLVAFVGKQGAILGRRKGQIRAVTQRKVSRAIKNARQMGLMPHVGMHPAYPSRSASQLQAIFDNLEVQATATQR